jgi:predicted nucleic acid-binding protein
MNSTAVEAVRLLLSQGEMLCVLPQNLIEFWAVATRPASANGLNLTVAEAIAELTELKTIFTFQPDVSAIFVEWEKLIVKYEVKGKQAHDTRLVAAMVAHGITHLLTFNTADFKRFSEITAIDPRNI